MTNRKLPLLVPTFLLAVVTACSQSPDTVEKKTESTTKSADETVKTTSETKQVGATMQSTSETKADTPSGTVTSRIETVLGTVTVFQPGKKIEVMTGEKKTHTFDLDDKDVVYAVDSAVMVGKRVTVSDETGSDKVRRITVKLGA